MTIQALYIRWAITAIAAACAAVGSVLLTDPFTRLAMWAGVVGVHVVLVDLERHPRKLSP